MSCPQKVGLAPKKKQLYAKEREQAHVQYVKQVYLAILALFSPNDLLFFDETGIDLSMSKTHARAYGGRRAKGKTIRNYGSKFTVLSAMGPQGIVSPLWFRGGITPELFLAWVKQNLVPVLRVGQVVVFDNLMIHHQKEVKKWIEESGCYVLYLPPYHPDLNPIEKCWSKLKKLLRDAGARAEEVLELALEWAISQVTPQDAKAWFKSCGIGI